MIEVIRHQHSQLRTLAPEINQEVWFIVLTTNVLVDRSNGVFYRLQLRKVSGIGQRRIEVSGRSV